MTLARHRLLFGKEQAPAAPMWPTKGGRNYRRIDAGEEAPRKLDVYAVAFCKLS